MSTPEQKYAPVVFADGWVEWHRIPYGARLFITRATTPPLLLPFDDGGKSGGVLPFMERPREIFCTVSWFRAEDGRERIAYVENGTTEEVALHAFETVIR